MQRVHYFDFLNVFACISVVVLHCNGYTHTFAHNAAWEQAILFETVFFSAVPIFFMLSGATLFNYKDRYTTAEFYKKRYTKTLIPYIVFGIGLYMLYFFKHSAQTAEPFNIHHFLSSMLTGQIPYANYWFFIPLFMLYLFIPLIEKLVTKSSIQELALLVSLVFFFKAIIPVINSVTNWDITQSTPIGGYCIYAILGYILAKTNVEKNARVIWTLCALTIILWGIRYTAIWNSTERVTLWFDYFGLYSVVPAVTFFLLAKKANSWFDLHQGLSKKASTLSSLSFGVYLTHGIVLALLPFTKDSFSYRIIGIPIVYISCCIIVFVLKKIPFVQKIVP
jgi:surface polysaccharide O-acyltransferase-like enzyme